MLPEEVVILIAMDDAYLSTVGKDRQAVREQQAAEKPAKSAAKPAGKKASSKRSK